MLFLLTAQQKNVSLMAFGNNGSDLSLGGWLQAPANNDSFAVEK